MNYTKKSPYQNIYSVLRINRLVSICVSIGAFTACILSGFLVYKMHQEALHNAFAITESGQVIPLLWQERSEQLEIEAKAHLERFHYAFYGLTPDTYEDQLEKALWLGNSSVDEVYRQKKADGVYNRILQYALVQKVDSIKSTLDSQQAPYPFRTQVFFSIHRGNVKEHYLLTTSGKLLPVKRSFPRNPHGLMITEFYENRLQKRTNTENK
ncbi:conjugal transfer protein TraK [Zunongwangia sp. HGR-M22]|uniref:conjugal transfer protein TraK n=1 Tax=Zunongwangia sp. HGR-M22 TaxID=3015168 RepID=UPI0022DE01B0|nr:conjugal transfer protein TraK [Zunongwangia sp. HGR-M22]WBL26730.1 conjugal transfer protein TraK [Zunongwangia sp. HGR-M22]